MRIGVLGGSFDPIHTGHAIIANYIAGSGVVDEVWLMVSRRNPLKQSAGANESQRLFMVSEVARNIKNVIVSDFELGMPEPSFTYDTLVALQKKFPHHSFKIIIGSDSLANFDKWRNSDRIIEEFGAIVYPRPGYDISGLEGKNIVTLSGVPLCEISSTLVRDRIKEGLDINYFVPLEVARYIESNNLYTT